MEESQLAKCTDPVGQDPVREPTGASSATDALIGALNHAITVLVVCSTFRHLQVGACGLQPKPAARVQATTAQNAASARKKCRNTNALHVGSGHAAWAA